MAKIHPNTSFRSGEPSCLPEAFSDIAGRSCDGGSVVLTVWRKSLVLSCSGYTVFDANGDLVFRVDSYGSRRPGELVLMDAAGKPLLTIRRKKLSLSLADTWQIYDGEEAVGPQLAAVKQHVSLRHSKVLAHVSAGGGGGYVVEGSYGRRSCSLYDERRRPLAEVRRKEAVGGVEFGGEVFRLVVHSPADHDARLAMGVVIVLDQMFESRS
ncbi:protein LURP-one-related 8-like [Curcuma longa]|uniref:protein LURP-one-related 8-like n=1 Tax=Curcuma longa TaxID=136217 RepID=UPI003D9FA2AA